MRSALRQLCRHGVEALRPRKVNQKWRKPPVSKRVAADLRKLAIRNGTYGKFDSETGVGWDPAWDAPERNRKAMISVNNVNDADASMAAAGGLLGSNPGGIASIRPPKETKRERTRETRAQKIEDLLAQADEKIEEYRLEQEGKKPKPGIEEEFKRAVKSASW
mmetsp:Transcript_20537/g.44078  ORF Transcript_20537/g.44078 Transcript_20537/m.44078 type:complete len:163 (-) Transcript_20537:119-607(-)|eukprot:CAMPEP_0172541108 /NCGR_PEP_ID=MMETSP1067-20121228/11979_1 /TAXON_ID=265564 ORGANISM="Thalassiosira punctigera, Strain Tpunct2005C2" /NCGR_SAMPLE_ID=MMETSP1067 /ASSEMBLY_ACC=CAM_ASM_000444 /LENGTH=162 /DNA_ID=CAMNT_0013327083 /DNA_START=183 /DNA_END=671 /DNA_ORIENTATION=-